MPKAAQEIINIVQLLMISIADHEAGPHHRQLELCPFSAARPQPELHALRRRPLLTELEENQSEEWPPGELQPRVRGCLGLTKEGNNQ